MLFDYSQTPEEENGDEMEVEGETANTTIETEETEVDKQAKNTSKGYYMFLGDTVPSFYRRPSSSSEGLFALIPCAEHIAESIVIE